MNIQPFPSGPFDTNAYVISCSLTRQAAIVDPAPESANSIIAYLTSKQLTPDKILLTHSHWDHIADIAELKRKYPLPVWIHKLDTPNLENPGADLLPCWISLEHVKADHLLTDGEIVSIGKLDFEVIHTPGHSPGSICLYCKEHGLLISGDTLFKGTIGNLSFPTSQPDLMWNSLAKLAKLPPNTIVYPGHGSTTSIGKETWLGNAQKYFGIT